MGMGNTNNGLDKAVYSYAYSYSQLEEENRILRETVGHMRERLNRFMSKPLMVCEVKDVLKDGVLIKIPNGNQFCVNFLPELKLAPGDTVLVEQKNLTIVKKIDTTSEFNVERFVIIEKPTVTFKDIGGLKEQIREIKEVIEAFAAEAYRCKQAGVDGVEIHGAHGYLITQFMSPATNKRTDEYGGSVEGRMRFPMEVIDAVRAAVGRDFTVGIRVTVDLLLAGGYSADDMKVMAPMLTRSGNLDYIAVGPGIPPMYFPSGSLMYMAAVLKEVVDIPVIGGGRIVDPVQAEKVLEDRLCDLVFMNRALICDPELPKKAREGRLDEIRRCTGCSEGCWMRVAQDRNPMGVSCSYNPTVGKETIPGWLELIPAERKKKVMVIGGGPAGLETARVAAARGHQVSLWEKGDELGGMVLVAAKAPGREDLGEIPRYYRYQMKLLGVDVHLNSEVTVDTVKQENPDVVVVATGSLPLVPDDIKGIEQDNVVSNVRDVLSGRVEVGQNVLIFDAQRHLSLIHI